MLGEIIKFLPSNFTHLSLEEKKDAIQKLSVEICKTLAIEPVEIDYSIKLQDKVCGKFFPYPKGITINLDYIFNQDLLNPSFQTLFTLIHECYHYYEYTLINKFLNEEKLTSKEKVLAATYFVSLYRDLFIKICEDKELIEKSKIDKFKLYKDTICEADANEFAHKMMNALTHLKLKEDERLLLIDVLVYCEAVKPTPFDMINALNYEREAAVKLLEYKKGSVKRNENYLNVDIEELNKLINKKISSLKENLDGNEKLLMRLKK